MGDQLTQKTKLVNQAARKNAALEELYASVRFIMCFYSWPLKMGPICCPETSVRNYHYSCVIGQKSALLRCFDNLRAVFGKYKLPPRNRICNVDESCITSWPIKLPKVKARKEKFSPATLCPQIVGSRPLLVEASWNVIAHAHKPDFVFQRNGRVHLNRRGR